MPKVQVTGEEMNLSDHPNRELTQRAVTDGPEQTTKRKPVTADQTAAATSRKLWADHGRFGRFFDVVC